MSKNTPLIVNAVNRHPALKKRDAAYAASQRHHRLTETGNLKVDPIPLATDLIGLRPMTKEEQIARYTGHGIMDWNLVPDEFFLSEDDFHDYLDDLPEEGYSPFEIEAMQSDEKMFAYAADNIAHAASRGRGYMEPPEAVQADDAPQATTLPEGSAKRPQKAGVADPDIPKV